MLGGQWRQTAPDWPAWESEWQVVRADLAMNPDQANGDFAYTSNELDQLQELDRQAWQMNQRVLYIPTFYAIGRVPLAP